MVGVGSDRGSRRRERESVACRGGVDVISSVSAEFGHREKRDGGVPGSLGIFGAHHGYVRSIADVRDVAHQSPRSHDSEPYRAPRTEGGASAHRPKQGTFFQSPRNETRG